MSSLRSAVASVLRLFGIGMLLLGIVFMVLAYAAGREGDSALFQWVLGIGGALGGVCVLVLSSTLARALTRDYD